MAAEITRALDWGKLAPLRLRARTVADGVYAGAHRSLRRGSGVEFSGHRAYVPGDDLRWLDRHALMRHDRLMVREFETETDRALSLIVDATPSMSFRSPEAPGAKLAYAAVVAAALGRVAVASGDPVALDWVGGRYPMALPAQNGREAFERLVGALESVVVGGDLTRDQATIPRTFSRVAQRTGRGSIVVLLSDLVDWSTQALDGLAALGVRGRRVIAVRVLDPCELTFPFEGSIHLMASEGDARVETDARMARAGYLEALESQAQLWHERLLARGGGLVRASSASDPLETVRAVLAAAAGRQR